MISSLRYNNRSEVMGRTTRVFGARVLRSGRRVWTGPALEPLPEGKHPHPHHLVRARPAGGSEELIEILENTRNERNDDDYDDVAVEVIDSDHHQCHDYKQSNKNVWQNGNGNDNEMDMEKTMEMEVDEKDGEEGGLNGMETQPESANNEGKEDKKEVVVGDRRWGIVYKRKRKREKGQRDIVDNAANNDNKGSVRASNGSYVVDVGRKFGRQFVRRKRMRETISDVFVPDNCDVKMHSDSRGSRRTHRMLAIVVEACASSGSDRSSYWIISCFLNSVLRYLRRAELGLRQLYAFVCSDPLVQVYSAYGIRFLQDFCTVASDGVCIISGARSSIPIFSVDFSALPFCFMYLHSSLLIRSAGLLHVCVTNSTSIYEEGSEITVIKEHPSSIPPERDQAGCEVVASRNDHTDTMGVFHHTFGVPKLAGKNLQLKNGRGIQKRRSSLRSKRGRPPSILRMQKANGALASELFRSRHNRIQLSPLASNRQLRSSTQRNPPTNVRELKSSLVELTQDIGAASCSANILIIESDKCYRVEGAIVSLELSESKRWSLTVKKDGMKRYSIKAQKVMRPCNTNRFTHAMLWIGDNSWKLEFPNRQHWLIFKELYKKCFDRNLQTPLPSIIPVPRACEVEGYADGGSVPFVRPDSYITMGDDELTRALVKRTANYDMDSDDEEWLNKFNNGTCAESDLREHLSAERFELMIDAFEKAIHSNPDDFSNEEAAFSILPDLERIVVEAVFSYWSKKRKQKRAALIRIFQFYQPRRTQFIPKSIFRKKRSFKRQGSQAGRGKQRTFLQALAAEQDAVEQQNAILKVQEAKASANRSEGLAIEKRQRAQLLMENADLATYKAAMSLRIAEAAQIAESTDASASFFLG